MIAKIIYSKKPTNIIFIQIYKPFAVVDGFRIKYTKSMTIITDRTSAPHVPPIIIGKLAFPVGSGGGAGEKRT